MNKQQRIENAKVEFEKKNTKSLVARMAMERLVHRAEVAGTSHDVEMLEAYVGEFSSL